MTVLLVVHSTAHASRHLRHGCFFFFDIGKNTLRSKDHSSNRSSVLQCHTNHFRRIDHTGSDQVLIHIGACIVPKIVFAFAHFLNYHGAFNSAVCRDLAKRFFQCSSTIAMPVASSSLEPFIFSNASIARR